MFKTIIALTLTAAAMAAPCPATFRIHPDGHDDYCVTVARTTDNPGPAYIARCNGSAGQLWKFETPPGTTDMHHIRTADAAAGQGTCLAAEIYRVEGPYNGRQLALSGCYNDGAQSWNYIEYTGQIKMLGQVDGRSVCFEVRDGNLNGGAVQIWYCTDANSNQRWNLESYGTH